MLTKRQSIITAALALALVALWAGIERLATQQVSTSPSRTIAKALFLCRTQQGTCAAALTQALIIEQREYDATAAADRACHAAPRTFLRKQGSRS